VANIKIAPAMPVHLDTDGAAFRGEPCRIVLSATDEVLAFVPTRGVWGHEMAEFIVEAMNARIAALAREGT